MTTDTRTRPTVLEHRDAGWPGRVQSAAFREAHPHLVTRLYWLGMGGRVAAVAGLVALVLTWIAGQATGDLATSTALAITAAVTAALSGLYIARTRLHDRLYPRTGVSIADGMAGMRQSVADDLHAAYGLTVNPADVPGRLALPVQNFTTTIPALTETGERRDVVLLCAADDQPVRVLAEGV